MPIISQTTWDNMPQEEKERLQNHYKWLYNLPGNDGNAGAIREMEDYVTYAQAKALKELGFDWVCNHWYHQLEPDKILESVDYSNHNRFERPYSAPFLSQAQKWLREVKGIHVWVEPEISEYDNDIVYLIYVWDNNKRQYPENYDGVKDKDTYEQALSVGIDKALELLK